MGDFIELLTGTFKSTSVKKELDIILCLMQHWQLSLRFRYERTYFFDTVKMTSAFCVASHVR